MLFSLYFLAAPSSVAAIRRTIQLHLQRGISDNCLYSLIYISILYKCYIEYIYADIIPFASSLHAHRCCVFRKHGEIAQEQSFSSLQINRGERSNIPSGALRTTPLLRMLHTFRAAVRK